MSRFNEKNTVEDYLVQRLEACDWKFIPADALERGSLEDPLLVNVLTRVIRKLNEKEGITQQDIIQVINEIKSKSAGTEGSRQILNYLKSGVPIKFEKDRVLRYVNLLDHQNISNEFTVSRQVSYHSGDRHIRVDIVLYVNGIPLVVIECKNPTSLSVSWIDAHNDIKFYEQAIPELFKYVQIGIAAERIAKFFPIVPWAEIVHIDEWKRNLGEDQEEETSDDGSRKEREGLQKTESEHKGIMKKSEPTASLDAIVEFLIPSTLLDIIKNFLFFREEQGQNTKVICRYIQFRSANKIVNRVLRSIGEIAAGGEARKTKGLVWHWQGSGKTLTMIFAANKLFNHPDLQKPSIFFIVDRIGLEEQLFEEFAALDIPPPQVIQSSEELRQVARHDEYKGKRGMMITLIHKFRPGELVDILKEMKDKSAEGKETLMTRTNVIALIDEGHRSQYGDLADQMKLLLKNSSRFAFTGTPIKKKGRDTYAEFSEPSDKKGYLDKYFITHSIKDGFTLKIVYQPRLEKEVHLQKDLLEFYLSIEDEEIPETIREDVKEEVKQKLTNIKVFFENERRIRKICQDIADHFNENVKKKFKAMVVAGSREACITYKKELDKLLPSEYSEIIMSFKGKDDTQRVRDYFDALTARYSGMEIDDIRKQIVNRFKEEADENPRILIVTDMLLYGFDAPILQTMYLDKLLKEHRLLQAIARTNRPYRDVKEAGLVLDYAGILSDLKKAFEMYSKEEVRGAISDIPEIRDEFVSLLDVTLALFKDLPKSNRYDMDVLREAFRIITSEDITLQTFLDAVKSLRKKYEFLEVDIKLQYLVDYKWILAIHAYYLGHEEGSKTEEELLRQKYVEQYFTKTIKLIHKTTEIERINKELQPVEFDENYLEQLEEKMKNKKDRAANIIFTLNKLVLVEKNENPVYESLVEKVQRLMENWKQKNHNFEEMYKEGVAIVNEIKQHQKRKKELNLSDSQYFILLTLETGLAKKRGRQPSLSDQQLVRDSKRLVNTLKENDLLFSGCFDQAATIREIEKEVRRFLRRNYVSRYNITLDDIDELAQKVMEILKRYES